MACPLVPPVADLCAVPFAVPPDGQLPNFVNPTSLTTATITISVLMTIWALAFVVARITVNKQKLSWSDHFMAIGMVFDIAYTSITIARSKYSRHTWDVPACWLSPTYMKLLFIHTIPIGPALYFSKSSIFLLYRQFFAVKKSIKIAVYIGLFATLVAYFPMIPLSIRYQAPHGGQSWADLKMNDNHIILCLSVVQGAFAVALDIYIFVLPLPTLATLQMSPKTRAQLVAVFSTALMGVIASVVALVYRVKLFDGSDPTWQQAAFYMALVVENNVTIIVGSMPAVAAFVRVYVSPSAFIKTLRHNIRRTIGNYSREDCKPHFRRPNLATFRAPIVRGPGDYDSKLTNFTVTAVRVVPDDHYLLRRNHTADYQQPCALPNSTDGPHMYPEFWV